MDAGTGGDGRAARSFADDFHLLTGHAPFRWQERLFARFVAGELPDVLDLPTGLGKTSVMAIWLLAREANPRLPRRLVYVVDRRVVVDQATAEAEKLGQKRPGALAISTLRGQCADNRAWLADPAQTAIIVGTIDMIGSRLLFEGYGVSRRMRPYHAGLLGADTLLVLDEAHLCPPFEALLRGVAGEDSLKPGGEARRAVVPGLRLLSLSATGREDRDATGRGEASADRGFRLQPEDADAHTQPIVCERYTAGKRLVLHDVESVGELVKALAERAWSRGGGGQRVLVFCDSYDNALAVAEDLRKRLKAADVGSDLEVLVGKRRVHEREKLVERLTTDLGFLHPAEGERDDRTTPAFLVATSAGEVGIDIDADHMVCDLVAFERMVQRLGRVNRRGGADRMARVDVFCAPPEAPKAGGKDDEKTRGIKARAVLLAAAKALLAALPVADGEADGDGGARDASPRALAELKQHVGRKAIDAATTPAPLRPALDRAVVDAWSMTSLREHPGRPEPQPWLRGWEDDEDGPQTQVIWRRFLPWRQGDAQPVPAEVEAFFAAARPHLSEILEAPIKVVLKTLIARARVVLDARKRAAEDRAGDPSAALEMPAGEKPETQDGLLVLTPARDFKRREHTPRGARPQIGLGAWTFEALAALSELSAKDWEHQAKRLANATVVVSASLGGLDSHGLLASDAEAPPTTADAPDAEEREWGAGFRVRVLDSNDTESKSEGGDWRPALRLPLATDDRDDPQTLTVFVARGDRGEREGDPAIGRKAQRLAEHGRWAAEAAGKLADVLGLAPEYRAMLVAAAGAHDLGKARDLWQNAMRAPRDKRPLAKTTGAGDPARLRIGRYTYRHEFGSLRDVEADATVLAGVPEELRELALHLIAAHHGYARPLIAPVDPLAIPAESEARAAAAALRFARLQRDWGPWGLAWWEALLRAADWAASALNDDSAGKAVAAAFADRPAPAEESA